MRVSYIKLALALTLWGGALVAGRVVSADLPPVTITWIRFLLVSVFLLPVLRLTEGRLPRPGWRDWGLLLILSATGVVLFNLFLFAGLKTVTAVRSSVLIALAVLTYASMIGTLLLLLLGEPLTWPVLDGSHGAGPSAPHVEGRTAFI